jgi:hypothetical protein
MRLGRVKEADPYHAQRSGSTVAIVAEVTLS